MGRTPQVISLVLVFIGQHTASMIVAWLLPLLIYFANELLKVTSVFS